MPSNQVLAACSTRRYLTQETLLWPRQSCFSWPYLWSQGHQVGSIWGFNPFFKIIFFFPFSDLALSLYSVGINSDPKGHYRHLMPSSPFLVLSLLQVGVSLCTSRWVWPIALPLSHTWLQSLVLPLQGFLNAIVYGWTNEDFVDAVVKSGTVSWRRGSYSHLDQSTSDLKSEEVSEPD